MQRYVSDSEKNLMSYKFALASSTSGILIDADIIHGLTVEVVTKIVKNCNKVFLAEDVLAKFPIWSFETAVAISNIVCDVVGDTDMYNLLEDTEEE